MIWTISGGRIRQRGRSLHEQVISLFPDKKKVYVQRDNRVFLVGYPSYGRLVHRCSQRGEYRSPESRVVCNCHCVGSLCASSPPKHSSGDVLGLRKVTDALPLKLLNKFSPPYRNPMKKKTFHDFADLGGPKELGGSRSMSQTLPVPRKLTLDLLSTLTPRISELTTSRAIFTNAFSRTLKIWMGAPFFLLVCLISRGESWPVFFPRGTEGLRGQ